MLGHEAALTNINQTLYLANGRLEPAIKDNGEESCWLPLGVISQLYRSGIVLEMDWVPRDYMVTLEVEGSFLYEFPTRSDVLHRFIVYVTKDLAGHHLYKGSVRYCNGKEEDVRVRLVFGGVVTKTGLEEWVGNVRLIMGGTWAGMERETSDAFTISAGQCVSGDVEYDIRDGLQDELDFAMRKLISDGKLFIAGYEFDLVNDSSN